MRNILHVQSQVHIFEGRYISTLYISMRKIWTNLGPFMHNLVELGKDFALESIKNGSSSSITPPHKWKLKERISATQVKWNLSPNIIWYIIWKKCTASVICTTNLTSPLMINTYLGTKWYTKSQDVNLCHSFREIMRLPSSLITSLYNHIL